MNRKIATGTGIITAILILAYLTFLLASHTPNQAKLSLFQFLICFAGILVSCFMLYRYYADIKFSEAFIHCMKTLATILFIMILGNSIMFYLIPGADTNFEALTMVIMKTIFSYSVSGILSALFSSLIFNTFTKK